MAFAFGLERVAELDVAVIGGGPAGAAAALRLVEAGLRVRVFEREPPPRMRIGESVGPGVRAQLAALHLADHWNDPHHRPALERAAVWADETLEVVPAMIQQVHGAGRQLDRNRFDAALLDAARARGVGLDRVAVGRVEPRDPGWTLITRRGTVHARWLVDASGGGGTITLPFGLAHRQAGASIGLIAFVEPNPNALARMDASEAGRALLIEATPEGWWYSALLADARLVAVFMADTRTLEHGRASAWARAREFAPHTRERLQAFVEPSRWFVRWTQPRLLMTSLAHHLPIGDVVRTGDPLAGHGIEHALDSAARGVAALLAVEAGDATAIERYLGVEHEHFDEHLRIRQQLYAAVERFADQPFWAARARLDLET